MSQPFFSIISPITQKYECFYQQLVNTISNQTFPDFEFLMIYDEKDTEWINVPDERFKIIFLEQEHTVTAKRNIGISKSQGKYIIFCDADDFFPIDLLQTFKNIADKYNADFIVPKTTRLEKDFVLNKHNIQNDNYICDKDKIHDVFFGRYSSNKYGDAGFYLDGCWGKAFKSEILRKYSISFIEPPCRAEDALFNNDFVLNIETLYLLPDYFGYYWRINKNSTMFNINSFFYNINPFFEKLYSQLEQCDKKYSDKINQYTIMLIFHQFHTFCIAHKKHQIKMKEIVPKLKNMFCNGSICYSVIRNKKALERKYMKLVSFLITIKAYRISVLTAELYMKLGVNI